MLRGSVIQQVATNTTEEIIRELVIASLTGRPARMLLTVESKIIATVRIR